MLEEVFDIPYVEPNAVEAPALFDPVRGFVITHAESLKKIRADLKAMQDMLSDPKTDLYKKIPWGEGQTILREALLVADHNAYHLAQIVDVRRALGAWQ